MNTRIRQVRKSSGLNQDDFAQKIGLTKNFISLVESGKREPSPRTVADICRVFNVNRSWLETGEGDMFRELDADQQLAEAVNALMDSPEDDLRRLWVSRVAQMTMEEVELMSDFLRSLLPE